MVPTVERGFFGRGLLVDRDRRAEPLDEVDVGLVHLAQELAGVRRQRLDVAPLALGEDRVEGQAGLPGAGQPGEDDEGVARQVERDVLEVVLPGAPDDELFLHLRVLDLSSCLFEQTFARLLATSKSPRRRSCSFGSLSRAADSRPVPYVAPVGQDEPMSDPQLLELLDSGTRRLVRSVDAMTDDQWRQPSLLPGWTRAHVVAHLTLNAEGLSGGARGSARGAPGPDVRLQRGARQRHRRAGLGVAVRAAGQVPGLDHGDRRVGGGAGGQPGRDHDRADAGRAVVPGRRRRRRCASARSRSTTPTWRSTTPRPTGRPSSSYCSWTPAPARSYDGEPFVAHATDLDRSWEFGTGGPTVSGVGSALAWWTTGRGFGDGLTSDDGRVPRMEPW